MNKYLKISILALISLIISNNLLSQVTVKEYYIEKQYLNFPVDMKQDRQTVNFISEDDTLTYSLIRLGDGNFDYWVFKDVSALKGKRLKLTFSNPVKGIEMIYQSDKFAGQDSLYQESKRPQFHFTSRRGWNNDPNGLVYFDGEYHLFYQHNPFETKWGNMHWGHAAGTDLLHWTEFNDVLYPDKLGTMFSGSAIIDEKNTAGWGKNTMVVVYTSDNNGREVQCLAYSTDKGGTFTKYSGNPVAGETRDPKVFWYEPNQEWVMALYKIGGISIFTSKNLKMWKEEDHVNGFYECPELFELSVDNNPNQKLWVLYGASGTYMLGDFDGKKYTPRFGKYRTNYGAHYAAQTYNNTPDGKRIQISWGQIEQPNMPFNQMMLFPAELTLRTTNEGIRLFSEPIEAIAKLHEKEYDFSDLSLSDANEKLKTIKSNLLHIKARLESLNGSGISIDYKGNNYVTIDADGINGIQTPLENPASLIFDIEILIDITSIETFYQSGQIVIAEGLEAATKETGLEIFGDVHNIRIHNLKVYELRSIWK